MGTVDIKIQGRCDHAVLNEQLVLQSDRKTFFPQYPIASPEALVLTRFGKLVPRNFYRFAQEQQIVYGEKYYTIILNNPELYPEPVYEAQYPTYLEFCPKCLGTEFSDDLVPVTDQDINTVSGAILLSQLVEKTIVTALGSNKYYSWAGCGLKSLSQSKVTEASFIISEMQVQVRTALENLKQLQLRYQSANAQVSPDEVLGTVELIEGAQDPVDPTVFTLYVQYTSQSGGRYDFQQLVELSSFRVR